MIEPQDAWKAQQQRSADFPTASPDDLEWANAIMISTSTRFGGAASQVRAFIDTLGGLWGTGKLADKTFSAMTSAQNPNGGQATTLMTLHITAMHWGAVLMPPGYTNPAISASGGNPYGSSVTATGDGLNDADRASIRHQAKRQAEVTAKLQ